VVQTDPDVTEGPDPDAGDRPTHRLVAQIAPSSPYARKFDSIG
jgi:hypothetical protein